MWYKKNGIAFTDWQLKVDSNILFKEKEVHKE